MKKFCLFLMLVLYLICCGCNNKVSLENRYVIDMEEQE